MSKAVKVARASVRGGFNLFWGLVASTIISALGVIIVARLLSPAEYGLIAVALIAPSIITIFRDWGVNSAMIKYIAQYSSENKTAYARDILAAGLLFELGLGFSLSLISFLLSSFLATNIFYRPEITPLIQTASFTILAGALVTAALSAFTGFEKMSLNSTVMICQSVLKTALGPLLIILGLGVFGAVLGITAAAISVCLISVMILYLAIYKDLRGLNGEEIKTVETIKTMLRYGLPLSVSTILSGFLTQFYNFLMVIYCMDQIIGNYQVAMNFSVLIVFLAEPINTVLFPAFSKLNVQKEMETLRKVFQYSVKYTALLVVPATAAVMALSKPIIFTIFGEKYAYAPMYLTLYVIIYLYTTLGSLSLGNLLNGLGETKITMKLTIVTTAIGLPLSLMLIPEFGITGLIAVTLTTGITSLIIGLAWIKKNYGVTVDWLSSAKILIASVIAATIAYLTVSQLNVPSWMELIIGGVIFSAAYITLTPLIGAINRTDIQNLREMLSELGPFSTIIIFLLSVIEKLLSLKVSINRQYEDVEMK